MSNTAEMSKSGLLAAVLFAMISAEAAAARAGRLYPAVAEAWTGVLESGKGRLAPVVAQLEGGLGLTPSSFAALSDSERKDALELALEAAQTELAGRSLELANRARALAAPGRVLGEDGRSELYSAVCQLDEIRVDYDSLLEDAERKSLAAAYGQAAARAWRIRNELLGRMEEMRSALPEPGRGKPLSPHPPSHHAVKLLGRMRETKLGWHGRDIETVLVGFGFNHRSGGKHDIYTHPEHPQLQLAVSRQSDDLAGGYAKSVVELIERLEQLRAAAAAAGTLGGLPPDFRLDELAPLAAPAGTKPERDLARLAPAAPSRDPAPRKEPPAPWPRRRDSAGAPARSGR